MSTFFPAPDSSLLMNLCFHPSSAQREDPASVKSGRASELLSSFPFHILDLKNKTQSKVFTCFRTLSLSLSLSFIYLHFGTCLTDGVNPSFLLPH
mmetsp:Transcript_17718/g.53116  ORF Transcript_17718/g.53116 Transcript_17718/m.53116 type:complete len:95 (+) Transcript_17718:1355-1639(+)